MNLNDVVLWDSTHNRFKTVNVSQVIAISFEPTRHVFLGVIENKDSLSEYGQVICVINNPANGTSFDHTYVTGFLTAYWHSIEDVLDSLETLRTGTVNYNMNRLRTMVENYLNTELRLSGSELHIIGTMNNKRYSWTTPFIRHINRKVDDEILKFTGVAVIDACYMPVTITLPNVPKDKLFADVADLLRSATWDLTVPPNHPFSYILEEVGKLL